MSAPLLAISDIHVSYGSVEAVSGVSIEAQRGAIVTVIGANGAGKTTLLNAIMGVRPATGAIAFDGEDIGAVPLETRVARGLCLVPERRELFSSMSVADNLLLGGFRRTAAERAATLDEVYARFPRLRERRAQEAGTLSGGERQMLAMGRALMARPKVLLLDEPSMGLSPILVDTIFEVVNDIHGRATTILLVEQNASRALQIASRGYVMDSGEITMSGEGRQLLDDPRVRAAYLGE